MPEKPRPQCRAIVLCDVIYRDEISKKLILVGTFHVIHTFRLPCVHPSMALYLALNEGNGTYGFRVVIMHVGTQQKVFEAAHDLSFSNPREVIEVNAPVFGITFANDGEYEVQVWTDDELIGQLGFHVNHVKQP